MTKEEILSMLEVIDQQMNSSVLGGMTAAYDELERLGYIIVHREHLQHSATMTQKGIDFLNENWQAG